MSIDLEYAIKKDIRNNPIVREVDREQKREFLRMLALGVAIVGMLLFSAAQPFKVLSSGYEIERLRQQLAEEESLNRKLTLELETWRAPQRLEERATKELQMIAPTSSDMVVLEVVPAPSTPDRSVIATARQDPR
jgi:cell division protein FtsL